MTTDSETASGMPGRYATALFDLAREAGAAEDIAADLDRFATMMDESEDLRRLVRSPVFSSEDQIAALQALLAKAGAGEITLNFFRLVAKKRRLFAVGDMIAAYRALLARSRGEVSAEVTSAEELSPDQIERLKDELRIAVGRDVQLGRKVDPAILGGLIVKVGSRMIDNSLKTKLANLRVAMKGIG